jgi:hypothetical protein
MVAFSVLVSGLDAEMSRLVRIPIESVHPFRSNPYSGSGVFVHLAARL